MTTHSRTIAAITLAAIASLAGCSTAAPAPTAAMTSTASEASGLGLRPWLVLSSEGGAHQTDIVFEPAIEGARQHTQGGVVDLYTGSIVALTPEHVSRLDATRALPGALVPLGDGLFLPVLQGSAASPYVFPAFQGWAAAAASSGDPDRLADLNTALLAWNTAGDRAGVTHTLAGAVGQLEGGSWLTLGLAAEPPAFPTQAEAERAMLEAGVTSTPDTVRAWPRTPLAD